MQRGKVVYPHAPEDQLLSPDTPIWAYAREEDEPPLALDLDYSSGFGKSTITHIGIDTVIIDGRPGGLIEMRGGDSFTRVLKFDVISGFIVRHETPEERARYEERWKANGSEGENYG